jgi:hypothetical protein
MLEPPTTLHPGAGRIADGCEHAVASIPWPNQHGRSAQVMSHWAAFMAWLNLGFPKEPGRASVW